MAGFLSVSCFLPCPTWPASWSDAARSCHTTTSHHTIPPHHTTTACRTTIPVPLIKKRRRLSPGGRFPPSFINNKLNMNKLYNCMFLPWRWPQMPTGRKTATQTPCHTIPLDHTMPPLLAMLPNHTMTPRHVTRPHHASRLRHRTMPCHHTTWCHDTTPCYL